MGRKSLAPTRIAQILDAFEQCVIEHGLAEATLQRVAEAAGVKLSIIDHYIGNREALMQAMIERFITTYQRDTEAFLATLPAGNPLAYLLDFYFSEASHQYRPGDTTILSELLVYSERHPVTKASLHDLFQLLENSFYSAIQQNHPDLPDAQARQTAYAILSLWYGHATMRWLGFDPTRNAWMRQTAKAIIAGA